MAVCASCGQELADDARFCSACGEAVEGPSRPREARKVVTALFADVVGSTPLGERLDPEDFRSVVGEGVARMAVAVEAFGGEVMQLAGDGLLAVFGARVAHEDDPERAVLAGLRIIDDIRAYGGQVAREWEIDDFAVRVGIETGLAVLGLVGGGGRVEYGAAGDVLNTAARLQAAADAGATLVGPETQRLIGPLFEWDRPRELALKGKADRVTAHPVRARRPAASERGAGELEAPMVGREEELAVATGAIERVLSGSGDILLVSGDAGIGKSRLIAEIRGRFERSDRAVPPRWLEGRCVSYGEGLPYWPFRGLLREWLTTADPGQGDVRAALRAESERLLGERAGELVPPLESVLGIAEDVAEGGAGEPPPEVLQRQIQEGVAGVLGGLAADAPLAIALGDLHWADSSSLALLERLLSLADEVAILVVLSARPERDHASWPLQELVLREHSHRAHRLVLEALPEGSDRGLLAALVGESSLPAELERRLLDRAEGNPLYLEELVRSLIDSGALARVEGTWHFDRDVPIEVPETVEKVILARIDRLSAPAQEILGVASVLGRQFPAALLQGVSDAPGDGGAALRELRDADLMREGPRWPAPSLVFKHTLIQEAAYRSLLKRRRQELHRRAVETIEALYSERIGEFWGMLAHHTGAAGDDRRAIGYHRRAGEAARRVHAVTEAIEHYTGAIASAGRLGLQESDPALRDSMLQRGMLHFDSGDPEAGRDDLERALEGARIAADTEMQVETLVRLASLWRTVDFVRANDLLDEAVRVSGAAAGPARVHALARLSIQYANQLRLERALESGEQALAVAEREGAGEHAAAEAMDALKLTAQQLGDLVRLDEITSRLAATLRALPEEDYYLHWALLESAFVPAAAGRWDEAVARVEEALELIRRRGWRMHEPLFIDALCWVYRSRGDYERALSSGLAASNLAHEVASREWAASADATLGWALLDARAPDAAAECLERGLHAADEVHATAQLTRCTCLLAWARAALGEREAAAELAARGGELLARVTAPPGRMWLYGAHAYIALARAHLAGEDPGSAEALVEPIGTAAAESGWSEPLACASLISGLARAAGSDAAGAEVALERALNVASGAGLPAPTWEAHLALAGVLRDAGRAAEADRHELDATRILEQLAAPLTDPRLREGLLGASRRSGRLSPGPA